METAAVSSSRAVNQTTTYYSSITTTERFFFGNTQTIEKATDLNFDTIQNYSKKQLRDIFQSNEKERNKALMLKQFSQISNDTNFNKVIFEKAKNMKNEDMAILSHSLTTSNSIDYYSYNLLSFQNLEDVNIQEEINSQYKLCFNSSAQAVAFLERTTEYIEVSVKSNKFMERPKEAKVAQGFQLVFDSIKVDYIDSVNEDTGVLSHYINYTKPLSLEEKQLQRDEEQFNLAMIGHGLDPTSAFETFQFKLMQKGYSKEEAFRRTEVYNQAGLLPQEEWFYEEFGVRVYDLSMLAHFPILEQSMMEAYETMDTEQLKAVASRMSGGFPLTVEELQAIFGDEENAHPRDVMARAKAYWDNLYGTQEKMLKMFEEKLAQLDIEQKFTTEDLTFVKDGIILLMEIYQKNSNKAQEK